MSYYAKGLAKLKKASELADSAPETTVTFRADEARALFRHMQWLSTERERLLDKIRE